MNVFSKFEKSAWVDTFNWKVKGTDIKKTRLQSGVAQGVAIFLNVYIHVKHIVS